MDQISLRRHAIIPALFYGLLIALFLGQPVRAETVEQKYEKIKTAFEISLATIELESDHKLGGLRDRYTAALKKLEIKIQKSGELKRVVAVRNEIKAIEENGKPDQKVTLKEVQDLREIYLNAWRKLETERGASRREKVETYRTHLQGFVKALTMEGELELALDLQTKIKELDQVALEKADGAAPDTDGIRLISVPKTRPAILKAPLAESKWGETLSFPEGRFEFEDWRTFGKHGKKGTLYLSAKGIYSSESSKGIHVWGGHLIAEDCQFRGMRLKADHTGAMFFIGCEFTNSTVREQGAWYGYGNYDAKFYFENCKIADRLTSGDDLNIYHMGLCMSRCEVSDVELPPIKYKGEPADRRKDKWLRVNRCHFMDCTVPLSFLMITNECLFTDCRFVDDHGAERDYKNPFTVTYYTRGGSKEIRKKPDVVTLKELPAAKLLTPVGALSDR